MGCCPSSESAPPSASQGGHARPAASGTSGGASRRRPASRPTTRRRASGPIISNPSRRNPPLSALEQFQANEDRTALQEQREQEGFELRTMVPDRPGVPERPPRPSRSQSANLPGASSASARTGQQTVVDPTVRTTTAAGEDPSLRDRPADRDKRVQRSRSPSQSSSTRGPLVPQARRSGLDLTDPHGPLPQPVRRVQSDPKAHPDWWFESDSTGTSFEEDRAEEDQAVPQGPTRTSGGRHHNPTNTVRSMSSSRVPTQGGLRTIVRPDVQPAILERSSESEGRAGRESESTSSRDHARGRTLESRNVTASDPRPKVTRTSTDPGHRATPSAIRPTGAIHSASGRRSESSSSGSRQAADSARIGTRGPTQTSGAGTRPAQRARDNPIRPSVSTRASQSTPSAELARGDAPDPRDPIGRAVDIRGRDPSRSTQQSRDADVSEAAISEAASIIEQARSESQQRDFYEGAF